MPNIKNKRAEAFKILNYGFWRLLLISLVFLAVAMLISSQLKTKIDIYDLKARIFSQRLLNSPNGISYTSEYNFRTYPGMISAQKFDDLNLSSYFEEDSDRFSASILLENLKNNTQKEIYLNKKWFERYYPLGKFEQYHSNLVWRYVLITNESIEKGRMLIKTVEANE